MRDLSKKWIDDKEFFDEQRKIGEEHLHLIRKKLISAGIEPVEVVSDDYSGLRNNPYEISKYTKNNKDLLIKGHLFEGKSRGINYTFTSKDDFPFWPMFVDTVSGFDAKTVKPLGVIFISQDTKRLLATSSRYSATWTKMPGFD